MLNHRNEAVVYDTIYRPRAGIERACLTLFWLHKTDHIWRVWDLEDFNTGLRWSALLGVLSHGHFSSNSQISSDVNTIVSAGARRDILGFEAALRDLDKFALNPDLTAFRSLSCATLCLLKQDLIGTLQECQAIQQQQLDVPQVFGIKASCFNLLHRSKDALAQCAVMEQQMGLTWEVLTARGTALTMLLRKPEALDCVRAALKQDPNVCDCYMLLSALLPEEQKSQLGEAFKSCSAPRTLFPIIERRLEATHQLRSMQVMLTAYSTMPESKGDPVIKLFTDHLAELRQEMPSEKPSPQPDIFAPPDNST